MLSLATTLQAAPQIEIEKLLAFSSMNEVRVVCTLSTAEQFSGEVTAEIAAARDGRPLWAGTLGSAAAQVSGTATVSRVITGLHPEIWEPTDPALYNLKVKAVAKGQTVAEATTRFGFRLMEVRNGQFHLNGRPIFMRGIAINPPGRGIPGGLGESRAFVESYVRFLKSQNVNIFRISTDQSQTWFDVCDELGMMLYAGRYGAPPGAEEGKRVAPKDFSGIISNYKLLFENYASHPSIVIYLLANELPVSGTRGAAFSRLLTEVHAELKRWDPTRPIIGNAGYGEGREGDVCDVHRYWGWYYNSFLTYYNLRDRLVPQPLFGAAARNQPLTFTECVGAFTGPLGEFNIIRSKQLAPQLGWIGHTSTPREDALEYQSCIVGQATESFRRMRPLNPRLAGIMPFTIFFYNWSAITSFEDMKPKPAMNQLATSYQPLLLSWELWTPNVYAGTKVRAIAHVINDDDSGKPVPGSQLIYTLLNNRSQPVLSNAVDLPTVPYFGTTSKAIVLDLPAGLATGEYLLLGKIASGNTKPLATNVTRLFVQSGQTFRKVTPAAGAVGLYDRSGKTEDALGELQLRVTPVSDARSLPKELKALVIGEDCWDQSLVAGMEDLKTFVRNGGRILCLRQNPARFDTSWLPQKISFLQSSPNDADYPPKTRPFREQMNVNLERPDHPVFAGIDRSQMRLWSDYTGWDQTKPGYPKVYPVTAGFKLQSPEALAQTAVLADYDRGLEAVALCEFFAGKGSVILCGFDLVARARLDPVADQLLRNLIVYSAGPNGHEIYPLIDKPVVWGDYATERGTVCGTLNGLLVNTEWVPSTLQTNSRPLPPNTGSWNMSPGEQFVPRGRNPFGPFTYSTGSSLKDLAPDNPSGEGFFCARVPEGRRQVATTIRNPERTACSFSIQINDAPEVRCTVGPGETKVLQAPLPPGGTSVRVRYAGDKKLVIVRTSFE